MAVTAVRAGTEIDEAGDLPGGELGVQTLPELPDGPHAPACLDQLFTRELHVAALSRQCRKIRRLRKGMRIDLRQVMSAGRSIGFSGDIAALESRCVSTTTGPIHG